MKGRRMMKKITVMLIVTAFGLSLAAQPALAGSKQRHRWQGVAIGLGAAILGHAIYNSGNEGPSCKKVMVYNHPCPSPHRHGYWEICKVWVAPKYIKVWNPKHYNRHGVWVSGQWKMIEKEPGYWNEQEIWVARR